MAKKRWLGSDYQAGRLLRGARACAREAAKHLRRAEWPRWGAESVYWCRKAGREWRHAMDLYDAREARMARNRGAKQGT